MRYVLDRSTSYRCLYIVDAPLFVTSLGAEITDLGAVFGSGWGWSTGRRVPFGVSEWWCGCNEWARIVFRNVAVHS